MNSILSRTEFRITVHNVYIELVQLIGMCNKYLTYTFCGFSLVWIFCLKFTLNWAQKRKEHALQCCGQNDQHHITNDALWLITSGCAPDVAQQVLKIMFNQVQLSCPHELHMFFIIYLCIHILLNNQIPLVFIKVSQFQHPIKFISSITVISSVRTLFYEVVRYCT